MAIATHVKVATAADDPAAEINKDEWNDDHVVTLGADENFVTNAEKTVVGNTSGTNTGDNSANTSSIAHSLATAINDFVVASGAGAFVKKTLAEVKTILSLGTISTQDSNNVSITGGSITNLTALGINNAVYLRGKNNGGSLRNLIGMDVGNIIQIASEGQDMQFGAGNIGIGTTPNANAKLHLYTGSAGVLPAFTAANLLIEDDDYATIQFMAANTGDSYIQFGDADDYDVGHIVYKHEEIVGGNTYNDFLQAVAGGAGVFSFGSDRGGISKPVLLGAATSVTAVYGYMPDAQVEIRGSGNTAATLSLDVHNSAKTQSMTFDDSGLLQISTLTASEILATDASKNLVSLAVATYPSLAELIHLKGVTSAIQTQFTAKAPIASPIFTGVVTLPTGDASNAPAVFVAGTSKTSPLAGSMAYDGNAHYSAHSANKWGVARSEQLITLTADYTLANSASLQKAFNAPANGSLLVAANTTYFFEFSFALNTMSSTNGAFGFGLLGTATYTRAKWWANASKNVATPSASAFSMSTSVAGVSVTGNTTSTTGQAVIQGKLVIGAAGTIIPAVILSVAAAAVVEKDSYFRLWAAGSNSVQSVGDWG